MSGFQIIDTSLELTKVSWAKEYAFSAFASSSLNKPSSGLSGLVLAGCFAGRSAPASIVEMAKADGVVSAMLIAED